MRYRAITLAVLAAALGLTAGLGAQRAADPWHVVAVLPDGRSLPIQAFDPAGRTWQVHALEDGNTQVLHVRAVGPGGIAPIKVIVSDDAFLPVKAIGPDGALWDVKAVAPDGARLDVKGVARSGHIIHIKAIGPERALYGVKAVSPSGRFRDVKGIRMGEAEVEATVNGVKVAAHVKAVPQAIHADEDFIWNVKAVDPDGRLLPVKAIDRTGGVHDVKAFPSDGDRWILDIKAIVNLRKLPVKMLVTGDGTIPVKAIGADGAIYDVKALLPDGRTLDVTGIASPGNVLPVKAVDAAGRQLGIKAISPRGAQYDVKGLKFVDEVRETTSAGVPVRAHVKAIPPVD